MSHGVTVRSQDVNKIVESNAVASPLINTLVGEFEHLDDGCAIKGGA